jgi:hypothetical protein
MISGNWMKFPWLMRSQSTNCRSEFPVEVSPLATRHYVRQRTGITRRKPLLLLAQKAAWTRRRQGPAAEAVFGLFCQFERQLRDRDNSKVSSCFPTSAECPRASNFPLKRRYVLYLA